MQTRREVVEPAPTVATDRTEASTYDPYAGRRAMSIKLTRAIYFIFGLIEALLLIRFVLKALGANAEAGFAQFIYGITGPLIAPIPGIVRHTAGSQWSNARAPHADRTGGLRARRLAAGQGRLAPVRRRPVGQRGQHRHRADPRPLKTEAAEHQNLSAPTNTPRVRGHYAGRKEAQHGRA